MHRFRDFQHHLLPALGGDELCAGAGCFQGPHNYVSAVAQRSNHRTLTQQLSGELMRQAWFDLGEEFLAIVLNDTGFILVERSNQCFQCYSG